MIRLKRAYQTPARNDGLRILVDRVWPRGVAKEKLKLHQWAKEIAPSMRLRKWFGHDPKRWEEFVRRYRAELKGRRSELQRLRALSRKRTVTLVYGAKDERRNQAVVLRAVLSGS